MYYVEDMRGLVNEAGTAPSWRGRSESGTAGAMQVIGHRGAAALAPENTWASFDLAVSLGVDAD